MMAHIYRVLESDMEGLHVETTRVTKLNDGRKFGHECPVLVLGSLPHVTVLPMDDVRWFWIEES